MNASATGLRLVHSPMTNNELTAKMAEDSTSVVAMDLYKPLLPAGDPVAARTFLPYRTSRTMIMAVRRMLSESVIEYHGRYHP